MPRIDDHAAVAALLFAEHPELPVSGVVINPPGGQLAAYPIAIQVPNFHPVARWAMIGDTLVTAKDDPGFVDVSATFSRDGIPVRVWDHLKHREAHRLLRTLGLEFGDDGFVDIDPSEILAEVVST